MRPQQFQAEIEVTDGTPKQVARRKYLKRLIANLRPNVMRQYGSVDGPAPVTQRPMTDEERPRTVACRRGCQWGAWSQRGLDLFE
jgi:hypothetical protein